MFNRAQKLFIVCLSIMLLATLASCNGPRTYWVSGDYCRVDLERDVDCVLRLDDFFARVSVGSYHGYDRVMLSVRIISERADTLVYDLDAIQLVSVNRPIQPLWYQINGRRPIKTPEHVTVDKGETSVYVLYDRSALPKDGIFDVSLGVLYDKSNKPVVTLGKVTVDLTRYKTLVV